MLRVVKLDQKAILPTVAHPGEDLGYDLYALEDTDLDPVEVTKVRTGISAQYAGNFVKFGLVIKDRSSMAAKGFRVVGGVIDSGYTGELVVLFSQTPKPSPFDVPFSYQIKAGDKIAQMIPTGVFTQGRIVEVDSLSNNSSRGGNGFGSTGA